VGTLQRVSRAAGGRGSVAVDSRCTVGSMPLSMWLQSFVAFISYITNFKSGL